MTVKGLDGPWVECQWFAKWTLRIATFHSRSLRGVDEVDDSVGWQYHIFRDGTWLAPIDWTPKTEATFKRGDLWYATQMGLPLNFQPTVLCEEADGEPFYANGPDVFVFFVQQDGLIRSPGHAYSKTYTPLYNVRPQKLRLQGDWGADLLVKRTKILLKIA